jgi:hypothetical protein
MEVLVFADPGFAARCARALIFTSEHTPVDAGSSHTMPYRVVSPETIEIAMHKRGAPGTEPGTDGLYNTSLARGGVLALGIAHNRTDAQIVQADLARLAGEIAG